MPMRFRLILNIYASILILAACFVMSRADSAQADSIHRLSKVQEEIVRKVNQAEGYLTPAMHKLFWSSFEEPLKSDDGARKRSLEAFRWSLDLMIKAQIEVMKSTELSVTAGKPVLSPGHSKLRKLAAGDSLRPDRQAMLERSLQSAEVLWRMTLEEMAKPETKEDIELGRGFNPNSEIFFAKLAQSRFRAMATRMKFLLDEKWNGAPYTQDHLEAGFTVNWPAPFQLQVMDDSYDKKWPPARWTFESWIDANNVAHINVEPMPEDWKDIGAELKAQAKKKLGDELKPGQISLQERDGRVIALIAPGGNMKAHAFFIDAEREKLFHLIVYAVEKPDSHFAHLKRLEKNIRLLNGKGK